MRLIVAITGSSGVVLGQRLLENLGGHEVHLVVSNAAHRVIRHELSDPGLPAAHRYAETDLDAPISSSSYLVDGMAIVPCSMKTLAAVAHGLSNNLIARAADNMLRTGRRLVVVPRETPLSLAGIENMAAVKRSGGIILPPIVAYYFRPQTVGDLTDFFVGKILDVLGIEHGLFRRWAGADTKETPSRDAEDASCDGEYLD